jgi:hypothetical protein
MAENKTKRTTPSVAAFLAAIDDRQRQQDAKTLAALIRKARVRLPQCGARASVG